jgi:hypothetical protein
MQANVYRLSDNNIHKNRLDKLTDPDQAYFLQDSLGHGNLFMLCVGNIIKSEISELSSPYNPHYENKFELNPKSAGSGTFLGTRIKTADDIIGGDYLVKKEDLASKIQRGVLGYNYVPPAYKIIDIDRENGKATIIKSTKSPPITVTFPDFKPMTITARILQRGKEILQSGKENPTPELPKGGKRSRKTRQVRKPKRNGKKTHSRKSKKH